MPEIQQNQLTITPSMIVDIIFRRRWLIVVPLCISLSGGVYFAFSLPRTYQAETSILVQAQTVPGSYVRSIVSSGINSRISTISQQVLSLSNLERIIEEFGLFEEEAYKNMYLEDKIEAMKNRIKVHLSRTRGGADAFSISYQGKKPDRVMRITNTLTSFFMDENLKLREAQAVGTSEFLDAELEKTRKKLVDREKQLSAYRGKYLGGLPDELESNLRALDRLQQQLTDKLTMLREAKKSLNNLNSQMAQAKEMGDGQLDDPFAFSDFEEEGGMGAEMEKLAASEELIESLLLRYTRQHPDVKKLQAMIDKLRTKVEAEEQEAETQEEESLAAGIDDVPEISEPVTNWAVMQQEMQLVQMKQEVQTINTDIKKIQEQMVLYQKRVENTPKREQDLLSLKRDYGNIKDVYNSILDRKLEAELAVNMEKKQKGEQFRILDHARVPQKPITPDVRKLLIFSLAVGMGVAGGIVFLLETFDVSIRRDEDIESSLGLPILASIPPLKNPRDVFKKRLEIVFLTFMVVYVAVLFSIFVLLNQKGIDRVLNVIKPYLTN
jgi:polysaccharide chain length determinant protein (PEP-CTERM system associated)